ncbi:glutamate racemase, partial [Streptomyces sp. S6]
QALRRIGAAPASGTPATGGLTVLLNGREGVLPDAAFAYAEGRALPVPTAAS